MWTVLMWCPETPARRDREDRGPAAHFLLYETLFKEKNQNHQNKQTTKQEPHTYTEFNCANLLFLHKGPQVSTQLFPARLLTFPL